MGEAAGSALHWLVHGDALAQAVLCVAIGLVLRDLLAIRFRYGAEPLATLFPPISILKPVHGTEPQAEAAFRSWCMLEYPAGWELIFAFEDAAEPLYSLAVALASEFAGQVRCVLSGPNPDPGVNGKSHNLAAAAADALHDWLLISDSDTLADRDTLRRFAAAIDERTGAVSATPQIVFAAGLPARLEQVLVNNVLAPFEYASAQLRGAHGLWGTLMLVRRECVDAAGGFAALGRFLTEDIALERALRRQGWRCALLRRPVDVLAAPLSWAELLRHWQRWLVGLRRMKPAEYACMALILLGWLLPLAALASLPLQRDAMHERARALTVFGLAAAASPLLTGRAGIGTRARASGYVLLPLSMSALLAAYCWSLCSTTVVWRGRRLRIARDGRIVTPREQNAPQGQTLRRSP